MSENARCKVMSIAIQSCILPTALYLDLYLKHLHVVGGNEMFSELSTRSFHTREYYQMVGVVAVDS